MNCRQVQSRLADFTVQNLSVRWHRRVETHLRQCARCRAELSAYHTLSSLLDGLPAKEPPRDVWVAVLDRWQDPTRAPMRRRWVWQPAWSFVAGAALAMSLVWGGHLYQRKQAGTRSSVPMTEVKAAPATWVFMNQHAAMAQGELFADRSALAVLVSYPGQSSR